MIVCTGLYWQIIRIKAMTGQLPHCILDTPRAVSDIFENIFRNTGNIGRYFSESCAEGPNSQFFLNLFIQASAHDWMNKFKKMCGLV